MKTATTTISLVVASLLLTPAAFAAGGDTATRSGSSDSPPARLDQVVVEDWWYPLRFESVDALNNARYYYRRDNERAAADEIRKAASWLSYASEHALTETKDALLGARTDLLTLADDLDTGKVAGAARLDESLAEASKALAEWHFYRAREELGRRESTYAAQDLEAAAAHLEGAAASAHLQYGPDTINVFEEIYRDGKLVSQGKTIDNDELGKHLDGIEGAVKTMAETLK